MPSLLIKDRSLTAEPFPAVHPLFTLRELTLFCCALFVAILAVPVATALRTNIENGRLLKENRDFVFFYSMGRMLNQFPPSQLYDFELQKKVAMEVHPLKTGEQYTPNPYPPFVGLLFRPFALLPFSAAYLLWISITLGLSITGISLAANNFFPDDRDVRALIVCFALSFTPFFWILMGGQISVIGFIGFVLAFREEHWENPVLSGLGLSLCLYKPTLLVLIVPMLLVTRRYKTLGGLAAGGAVLAGLVTAVEGAGVWSGYFRMLLSFGSAAAKVNGYRRLEIYMDLPAFSALLPGGRSRLGGAAILACACCAAFFLSRAWWKHRNAAIQSNPLLWATTLTWTFVLNLYVPIYDSISAVPEIIATAAVLRTLPRARVRRQFTVIWILILCASWFTIDLARSEGFQVFTVLFALLGIVQLTALNGTVSELPRKHIPSAPIP